MEAAVLTSHSRAVPSLDAVRGAAVAGAVLGVDCGWLAGDVPECSVPGVARERPA